METIKEANKFSFGLGIFMLATSGFTILLNGFEIRSTFFVLFGIYQIWQQGFVNDASKWKVKPALILGASVILLLATFGVFQFIKSNSSRSRIFEEVENMAKKELPKALGNNGDSIVNISTNEQTIEYLYKMNLRVSELDSSTLKSFESDTRILLEGNMNKINPDILNEYRRNNILFRHKYVDIDGNIIGVIEINVSDY